MQADRGGYLDLEAQLDGTFLHPGGRDLTRYLLRVLQQEPAPRQVLELGCGTGSTAALVAALPDTRVVAVERSGAMLHAAQQRTAAQIASGRACLVRADGDYPLPFAAATFDAAYAESVVALLDAPQVFTELARVLRPDGLLLLNERVWKPGLTRAQVAEVNDSSQRAFGIPAATAQPWDRDDWQRLLRDAGFTDVTAIPVDDLLAQRAPAWHVRQRSTRLRRYLARPAMLEQSLRFKVATRRQADLWARLECFVFLARKPETARRGAAASASG